MSSLMACIAGMALDAVSEIRYGSIIRCGSLESGFRGWKNGCADFAKMRKENKGKRELLRESKWRQNKHNA